ncbi:thiol:disulfide interchange protein DsbA/DsbL [Ferrimonas kyonanensis]|uniref:thiol:disulfide interchange protein DsbA/DsbL n=2 Tax=Ferrimonas TaxID=44011 RepID=UPI00048A23F8|nr:thiol:disulfide interchange protein DsbA/DsbL [Ferrimonas kyonanensis]
MLARLIAIVMMFSAFAASAQEFKEGVHYKVINGLSETSTPVVREFFSYNCGHCEKFDPALEQIMAALGDEVTLKRTPVGFGRDSWKLAAKGYYLTEILGTNEQMHQAFFNQIHRLGQPFTSEAQLKQFFVSYGVTPEAYDKAADSADLKLAIADGDSRTTLSQIRGVPSVLVNGKYMVVNPGRTLGDYVELIKYLISKG